MAATVSQKKKAGQRFTLTRFIIGVWHSYVLFQQLFTPHKPQNRLFDF
jgi:hypothetical protein